MAQTPFFSITIPTRNRPELFKDALQSVLLQDFDDFEVIVSDNSTDDSTQVILESFRSSPKLTIFRTDGNLSMPQHWEFITQKARGRYVLVLTDRSVLKQHALNAIHAAISSSAQDILVCSWRWSLFDEISRCEYADFPMIKEGSIVSSPSQNIAQNFVNGRKGYPYDLPRALNSCYRNDLAAEIRKKHGALFLPLSPDFTCAFLLLAYAEQALFLDIALFISQGLSVSNGTRCQNSVSAAESYLKTLGISDYFAHVPIKMMAIVESAIFEDFLAIQKMAGGELTKVEMNWAEYFVRCYKEIIGKNRKNSIKKEEFDLLRSAWEQALNDMNENIQDKVKKQIRRLWWLKFKLLIQKIVPVETISFLMRIARGTIKNHSNTALKAAGHNPSATFKSY